MARGNLLLRSRKNTGDLARSRTLVWRVPPQLYSFRQVRRGLKRFKAALLPLAHPQHFGTDKVRSGLWVLLGDAC